MKSMKIFVCMFVFCQVAITPKAQIVVKAGNDRVITCDGSVQLTAKSFFGGIWEQIKSSPKTGNAICFVNDSIGFLGTSSGLILKTVDACNTWIMQKPATTSTINVIKFLNGNIGFAAGSGGALLRTTDAGDTWIKIETNILNALGAIYILSPDKIFVTGSGGVLLMSNDGGLTWLSQIIDSTPMLNFNDITFSSPNEGYISGNYGLMFKTEDGGQNWFKQDLPFANAITSMSFLNDSIGIAVGSPRVAGDPCVIYKTRNGGLDWIKVIGDVVYEDYLAGNDSITGVNGVSLQYADMHSVCFVNEKLVFATVYKYETGTIILKSNDAGNNWKIDKYFPGNKVYGTHSQDLKNGYICGGGGFIAKYTATPSSIATYSWYPTIGLSDPNIANPVASPTETTTYYVTSSENGSTATDSLTVQMTPLSSMPGTNKTIGCEGSVQLDSVKSNYCGSATLKYSWIPSDGLDNDTIPNPIATVTSNTTYTFSITTPSGCTTSNTVTVMVNDLIVDAGEDKTIVCGSSIQMDSVKTNYSGLARLRYKWTPSIGLSDDTIPNPICTTINSITYTVTVSSGQENCSASDIVRVNVSPLTVAAGTDKSVTCGSTVLLDSVTTNYTGNGKLSYKWSPSIGLDNDTAARPTFKGNSSTIYTVTVTTPLGCIATDNVVVNVNPITVNVGADRSGICGSAIQLGVVSINYKGSGLKYKWSPSIGLSNDTVANPVAIVSTVNYLLTVTTPTGCIASDDVALTVIPMPKPSLKYTAINSDNHNQLYWTKPFNSGIESFNIYKETNVYNVYSKISSVAFSSEATFIDTLSNPDIQSNKYKISIVEQCGGETALSDYHKTLHLSINKGINTIWNLNWEPYEGFTVATYNIYRGTTPADLQIISSMSGSNTQYSDYTAPGGNVYYQIEAVGFGSSFAKSNLSAQQKTQSVVTSRSNIATNKSDIDGLINLHDISVSFEIFPNPTNSNFVNIKIENKDIKNIQLSIINDIGQVVKSIQLIEDNQQVDISGLNDGLYLMILKTEKMLGRQKLLIQR